MDSGQEKESPKDNPEEKKNAPDVNNTEIELFKARPSLLSSEASANSYRGLLNLAIILLILTNFRLVVENMMKYGFLLKMEGVFIHNWYQWPAVLITLLLIVFILNGFILELFAAKKVLRPSLITLLQVANVVASVAVPATLLWVLAPNPASGIIIMLITVNVMMKLVSYAHVNHTLRQSALKKKTPPAANEWPNNLTIKNMAYFTFAPTLCYQVEYPRTEKLRKLFLLRRIGEAVFFSLLILAIVEQYIIPLVRSSVEPVTSPADLIRLTERLLKLSIPNLYVWLLGFYVFFHLLLNILAELLQFGDRLFYKDWWNSTTLSYFWSHWNLPVHQWMMQNVYIPARKAGFGKLTGYFFCFLISAIFHELVVGIPFKMIKGWTFFGMMIQMPLIAMTANLRGNQIGNVLFWFSVVLGQPFCVLMMYRSWYQRNLEISNLSLLV